MKGKKYMKTQISLDGKWNLTGVSPTGETKKLQADVPGMVHVDLEREGIIPEMFWRDNADQCQWVEDWTWIYERSFKIPQDFDLAYCEIEFGGLDTYAEIEINGKAFAKTDNMFVPYVFGAEKALQHGENSIKVTFTSYKEHIKDKDPSEFPAAFVSDRVFVRRMQCTFFWDWVNRFVTAGLWKSVTVTSYEKAKIEDLYIYTKLITKQSALLEISVETECKTASNATVEIISPNGVTVWHDEMKVWAKDMRFTPAIPDPQLWWPVGYGEHPLYTCKVCLFNDGTLVDERAVEFGIKTIFIEEIQDAPGSDEYEKTLEVRDEATNDKNGEKPGSSFTLILNNERIFCKGSNWVPCDPFPSRVTDERYDRLVWMAKEAGINVLRCWGGGLYEKEGFWKACDKYGVMVSQDFNLACAKYPEDDAAFVENVRMETEKVTRMLRNHASLAWWTGNNENAMSVDVDDIQGWCIKLSNETMWPVMRALDPSRPFRLTSPYGGSSNSSLTMGDVHYSGWDDMRYEMEDEMTSWKERQKRVGRFMSESGIVGCQLPHMLKKFMTEEDMSDPENKIFEFHTKDNPYRAEGFPTLYGRQAVLASKLLGEVTDTEDKIFKQTYFQYEWLRVSLEAVRRLNWYNSGIQYWMYNDSWPATGWSMIDYYTVPKGGFYAMKDRAKPVIASIDKEDGKYKVYICNDNLYSVSGTLDLFVQPFNADKKNIAKIEFTADKGESKCVFKLDTSMGKDSILVADIKGSFGSDRAFYFDGIPSEMEINPVKLNVKHNISACAFTVSANGYARAVTFEGEIYMEDCFFDLLPGETKTVKYECLNGSRAEEIKVYCQNQKK